MKKVIIFTNSDHHFYAHLLPIALKAKNDGYNVLILTSLLKFSKEIIDAGFSTVHINIKPNSLNPFSDLILLIKLIKILSTQKPDILQNFTIKPILYGSIAAFVLKIPQVINVFLGMGALFISTNITYSFLRLIICKLLNFIGRYKKMLFVTQNSDDAALLSSLKISDKSNIITQCSVGVPTKKFELLPESEGRVVFALVARILIDKGIREFVEAAKILKNKGLKAEFWLVGNVNINNKRTLSLAELRHYNEQGYVKYLGYEKNIKKIWKKAHVAVLPSYREGLSRSLLEAGAYGKAVITTDVPGGRELIRDHENGLLVKPKDAESLANAMEMLILNPELKKKLAKKLRSDILMHYDSELIATNMVDLYNA